MITESAFAIRAKEFEPAYLGLGVEEIEGRAAEAVAALASCRVCVCKSGRYALVGSYFPQYPAGAVSDEKYPEINRKLFREEYEEAARIARDAGLWRSLIILVNICTRLGYNHGIVVSQTAVASNLKGGGVMLKKLLMVSVAMLFVGMQVGLALAANPDTGPGCGLGKLAWADFKHQKNIGPQVLMATTNGTFGSQTFGISTGTSGCTNDGKVWAEHKVNVFAAINFENLSQEMAQGKGEHLASLATLMGVPVEHQAEFFAMTQERYASLVQAGETSPIAMVKALNDAVAAHPVLAKLSAR